MGHGWRQIQKWSTDMGDDFLYLFQQVIMECWEEEVEIGQCWNALCGMQGILFYFEDK